MRGAVLYGPRDVRLDERDGPKIVDLTDAIIRLSATCICGSDLWPYRGIEAVQVPAPMGHEYVGIVEEVGSAVRTIEPGQFVIGSFFASDNTCEICRSGYQSACVHREAVGAIGTQAERARVPLADGTLVATPDVPPPDLIPSLLAASDVLGNGLVRRGRRRGRPGQDRRGGRGRRSRSARGARREAPRRGTDHRHEPPRSPPEARARVRRH